MLVRFEDLAKGDFDRIENYLGFPLSQEAARLNPSDGGPAPLATVPEPDWVELDEEVGELAAKLGYGGALSGQGALAGLQPQSGPETKRKSNCVVLVPVAHHVEPACEEALRQLEARGYEVRRVWGHAAIDQGRSQMATEALRDGFEELMWVDSDIAFQPQDVDKLRAHGQPLVCCIYPKKGRRELACDFLPGTEALVFGQSGGLVEVAYAGFGFMLTRREVYEEMRRRFRLTLCNERSGPRTLPYFLPMVAWEEGEHWYLAEDYAFCRRARDCGYRLLVDTTIRLWHIGTYGYSWEDAGSDKQRYATYRFHIR